MDTLKPGVSVTWTQNPLRSVVTLDDHGRLALMLGIAVDGIYTAMACHGLSLRDKDLKWIEQYEYPSGTDVMVAITEEAKRCEESLAGWHCGDCTCVPASCAKCHAEGLLGIDTLDGLGKHPGHYIQSAFSGEIDDIEAAIRWLVGWKAVAKWAGWEAHAARWRQERNDALAWLVAYRDAHFSTAGGDQ